MSSSGVCLSRHPLCDGRHVPLRLRLLRLRPLHPRRNDGVALPRTATEQYYHGAPIPNDQLQPGDLVFFKNTYKRGISHVGIYAGEGKFIHAANAHKGVRMDNLGDSYYLAHYAGARRVLPAQMRDVAAAGRFARLVPPPGFVFSPAELTKAGRFGYKYSSANRPVRSSVRTSAFHAGKSGFDSPTGYDKKEDQISGPLFLLPTPPINPRAVSSPNICASDCSTVSRSVRTVTSGWAGGS